MTRKKVIAMVVAIILLICVFLVFAAPVLFQFPVIGTVYGPENEYLEINGDVYVRTTTHGYTSLDREVYIGVVKNEAITMRVFEVEEVDDREYLHALWEWEGYFYVRQTE